MLVTALLIFLVVPALQKFPTDGNNMITILLNGKQVGIVGNANDVENMVNEARRRVAKEHSGLVLFESNVILTGSREIFGHRNTPEEIVDNMYTVFVESMKNTKNNELAVCGFATVKKLEKIGESKNTGTKVKPDFRCLQICV